MESRVLPTAVAALLSAVIIFAETIAGVSAGEVIVAAAADLKVPLEKVADEFTKEKGSTVKLSFKPAGDFYHEMMEGNAPYEVFMSADETYPIALNKKGMTKDRGVRFARGHVGLLVPNGSPIKLDAELADLKAAVADGRLKKIVIADPHHAPYGVAAQEVLESLKVWKSVKPKLVMAKSSTKVVDVVSEQSAQAGIIPMSVTSLPAVKALGAVAEIPDEWYQPINQRMVLMKTASPEAKEFYDFMQQSAAQSILQQHGYTEPDLTSPVRTRKSQLHQH